MGDTDKKYESKRIAQQFLWALSIVALCLLFSILFKLLTYPQNSPDLYATLFGDKIANETYWNFLITLLLTIFLTKWSGEEIKTFDLRKVVYSICGMVFLLVPVLFWLVYFLHEKTNPTFHSVFAFYMACLLGGAFTRAGYIENLGLCFLGFMTIINVCFIIIVLTGWFFQSIVFDSKSLFLAINLLIIVIIMGEIFLKQRPVKEKKPQA